jgi:hypothetical protein
MRLLIKPAGDKFINKPGEDEVTRALLNRPEKEKLLQILDRLDRETDQDYRIRLPGFL